MSEFSTGGCSATHFSGRLTAIRLPPSPLSVLQFMEVTSRGSGLPSVLYYLQHNTLLELARVVWNFGFYMVVLASKLLKGPLFRSTPFGASRQRSGYRIDGVGGSDAMIRYKGPGLPGQQDPLAEDSFLLLRWHWGLFPDHVCAIGRGHGEAPRP
jgi:hypothetical protein